MTLDTAHKTTIETLIKKGVTMHKIAETIGDGCTWQDIQEYCWQSGTMSWQGSKKIVSNCLKKLPTATTEKERRELVKKIHDQVTYLYYVGKEMRSRVVAVEKALKHL